ncbi:sigma-70 family RNA polymerase sigma factor [Paenibacillus sp. BR1-192]|uniref:sigma-70 family RNA polymerase sigma factor n=1 Tax=Paenibacillus sp. BR1-192 TaxID=3032287 RepID=UPI00240D0C15|nr:sigma-70 family RNA polymerase sigma factor [Paenibacillus sp. BR1-192]WFB57502.1 sigma-70 family RNA polymerase sigma factor [Paenibacillus sp. BR1-192]
MGRQNSDLVMDNSINEGQVYNPHLGDIEEVINENMGLVSSVALNWQARTKRELDMDDLMQEGIMGLMKAYQRYTPGEAKFSTFAHYYIKKYMFLYIRDHTRTIKPSRYYYEVIGKIVNRDLKKSPPEEISKILGYPLKTIKKALEHLDLIETRLIHNFISPDAEIEQVDVFKTYEDYSQIFVNDFMDSLNETERRIVRYRYFDMTFREIGKEIGVSHTLVGMKIKDIRKNASLYFWGSRALAGGA